MKPSEFWAGRYKEIRLYCEMNLVKTQEDFKQDIILQEAVTNKMIQADSFSKKPKIVPLSKTFSKLFGKNRQL